MSSGASSTSESDTVKSDVEAAAEAANIQAAVAGNPEGGEVDKTKHKMKKRKLDGHDFFECSCSWTSYNAASAEEHVKQPA